MKKYIVILLAVVLASEFAFTQDAIKILSYDYSNYPRVENNIFVFDNSGQPVKNLNAGNFAVRDNGLNQSRLLSYNCSDDTISDSTSLTVVFDLALSTDYFSPSNYSLGIQTANRLINLTDSNKTEISLTSFDYRSFLNREFTYRRSIVLNELNLLKPVAGSLFDAAFFLEPAGAFKINSRSKHSKSIILITDGGGLYREAELLKSIAETGAKLFIILINKPDNQSLKNAANSSGGWLFTIDNISDINPVVYSVLAMSKGHKPCRLSWEMDYTCDDKHSIEILLPSKNIRDDFSFEFNNFEKSTIISDPQFLGFSSVEVGTKKQLSIVITAVNKDIFIKELQIKKPFAIVSGNVTNYLLPKDQFINITIEYTPQQEAIVFSQLDIISDACQTMPIYITGGYPNTKPTEKTVKILHPNGGEYLIIGDTSFVKWLGLLPKDVIQLQYSIDNGMNWDTLATNVTGLTKQWIVPDKPSDSCLVKIIQLWPNNVGFTLDLKHNSDVNTAFFNPAGDLVLTTSSDTTAVVWIANTGAKKFTLKGHNKPVHWAVFDPKDQFIITASQDSSIIIWSQIDGSVIKVISDYPSKVESVNFSPSGDYFVTADFKGYSVVYDRNFNVLKRILANDFGPSWYSEFNPINEDLILSANGDGKAKEWNWKNYKPGDNPIRVFSTESIYCTHTTYNIDATKIAATTGPGNPKKLYVWDASDITKFDYSLADTLYSITHNTDTSENNSINYSSFFFHPDLSKEVLLTTSTDETARLWDASDGKPARINDFITDNIFREHRNSVTTAVFDKFGTRLLTASWDSTAKIWNLNQKELQQDVSDSVFTIAYARGKGLNIDMGTVYLSELKDSIIPAVFINESKFKYEILSYKFTGAHKDDFELLTELKFPALISSLDSIPLEIRFYPKDTGLRTAELEFELPAGVKVKSTITGFCDLPDLKLDFPLVDMGVVPSGSFKDSLFTLIMTNVSGGNIELDSISVVGSYKTEFTSVQNVSKNLANGESIPVTIRFTPQNMGRKNAQYQVKYKGKASPRQVNLFGEGIEGRNDSLRIYIKDAEAFPGDIVKIPIYVGSVGSIGIADIIDGITTNMRFNATLLEPLTGFTTSEIKGEERLLTINLPKVFGADSILTTLEFKALWGNDTISPLILEYSVPRGSGRISITENSSVFKLKGVCIDDGKPRLFLPGGGMLLSKNIPNPAETTTSIMIKILENGPTRLSICDVLGNEVLVIIDKIMTRGDYKFDIDVSSLPAGIYNTILITPSSRLHNSMLISR